MSFQIGEAPDREDLHRFPKVARQHELAARGLPVPPGVVLDLARARQLFAPTADAVEDGARSWVEAVLAGQAEDERLGARLIARSAGSREDQGTASGAGLGMSIAGIGSLPELHAALSMIEAHGRMSGTSDLLGEQTLILLQREVPRRALLVVVRDGLSGRFYVEVHGPEAGPEPLAEGRSPSWSGALDEWSDDSRELVEALADSVAGSEAGPHGVDLEIVVDPAGNPWIVQARPLTAPLHPGWPAFLAALEAEGSREPLDGRLILDGEHNPTPLSPAHAWVMEQLRRDRPGKSGDPAILAGWLYVRALPRELGKDPFASDTAMAAREALAWLSEQALPKARAQLEAFDDQLGHGPPLGEALEAAWALFLTMIDSYVEHLVPARRAALAALGPAVLEHSGASTDPLTLRDRNNFLDVLPATWDVASPSLAELFTGPEVEKEAAATGPALDGDEDEVAVARLLGEWDDHLFALGLAPLRRLWLYAADRLRFGQPERVFLLTGDELVTLDTDRAALGDARSFDELLDARARRWTAHAELEPPARIVDGLPVPHSLGGQLRGLAIGESFTGAVVQRRDLRDLLSDPPASNTVLCIPALTAQAAVALHRLGVRAVCTEYGGALAHGALMARELGLSALIGCRGCTRLTEGQAVRVDTRARRLIPLAGKSS